MSNFNSRYYDLFTRAVSLSRHYGLIVEEPVTVNQLLLPQPTSPFLQALYQQELGAPTKEQLVGQCLAVAYRLLPALRRKFGNAYFTVGSIWSAQGELFAFSEDDVHTWMTTGLPHGAVDLHAWVTLPSMEIIDMTLGTSAAFQNNQSEAEGIVIAQHPDTLRGGLRYHPKLVGEAFLERTGALVWTRAAL